MYMYEYGCACADVRIAEARDRITTGTVRAFSSRRGPSLYVLLIAARVLDLFRCVFKDESGCATRNYGSATGG